MSLDTRDYWKEKWNKRAGYSEKSEFRLPHTKKPRFSFLRFFERLGLLLFIPVVFIYLAKYFF